MTSSNRVEKVAIIGANGNVGSYMVQELLATGTHTITAITRHDSPNTTAFPSGLHIAKVDYSNPDTLVSALRGQDFLVITLAAAAPPDLHTSIVQAAVDAGVKYIMPNCYGADFMNENVRSQEMHAASAYKNAMEVQELGASYVAMSCGFWYEWSLACGEPAFGLDLAARKAIFFDDGEKMISTSTWRQCGKALAALLTLPVEPVDGTEGLALSQWKNKQLFVQSFEVSQRDMLDSAHRVLGTTDADWDIEKVQCEKRIKEGDEALTQGDRMGFVRGMYTRYFHLEGGMQWGERATGGVLGLELEDLDVATKRAVDMVQSGWTPFGQKQA